MKTGTRRCTTRRSGEPKLYNRAKLRYIAIKSGHGNTAALNIWLKGFKWFFRRLLQKCPRNCFSHLCVSRCDILGPVHLQKWCVHWLMNPHNDSFDF